MSAPEFRPRDEIVAAFTPGFADFTTDLEGFFDFPGNGAGTIPGVCGQPTRLAAIATKRSA